MSWAIVWSFGLLYKIQVSSITNHKEAAPRNNHASKQIPPFPHKKIKKVAIKNILRTKDSE